MEIDPRLRHSSDGAEGTHSYVPSPVSRHDTTASSTHTASDYPDPPSHYSPGGQLHSATSTSGGHSYGAPTTKSHPPQILYQGGPSPTIRAPQRLDPTEPNDAFADLKRPRACEACRQLKVRCEPDLINPNGSCKRCAKAGRSCVVTAPTRKRQKKTDSRVAELERKLNALTETLQVTQGHDVLLQTDQLGPQREDQPGQRWLSAGQNASPGPPSLGFPASLAGNKRRSNGEVKDSRDTNGAVAPVYPPRAPSPPTEQVQENESSRQWRGSWSCSDSARKPDAGNDFVDAIDRGLVSAEAASEAFDRYVNEMAPHMPMVVFPAGTKMSDIRKTKPVLLHAIIAASIGAIQPDAQLPLLDDLYKSIAERVVVKGEKSLDLVQALLVACNWYTPPDHFEDLKFYQLTNMAVSAGMDIGMNRKMMPKNKHMSMMKDWAGKKSVLLDPDSPETRRTWLGCYGLSVQVSTSLRRVLLVRWQPYMDECIEILEKSPDALPSDKAVIQWAKLMHLLEDINVQLSTDDSGANVSFSDPNVQYTLKVFEKQIEQWRKETPPEIYNPILQQVENLLKIHMRENALHIDIGDDQKTEAYSSPPSPAHMNALSVCLTSIHQALDTVCFINTKDLISLPTVCLARSSTAVVALIKLYSLVSAPETQIGQVIDPASLKVEYYLNKVIKHYTAAGEQAGGRTPAKFSVVLGMLLNWFNGRKDQNKVLRDAFKGAPPSCPPIKDMLNPANSDEGERTRSNHIETGQTPLHLLSEVAMGEPKNRVNVGPLPYQHRPSYAQHSSAESTSQATSSDLVSQSLGPSSTTGSADPWAQYQSVPLSSATTQPQPHAESRQLYSQFGPNYQDMSGYPDPSNGGNMMIPPVNQGWFIPELGMQVGFDSENLSALGYMLGEDFLNLQVPADANMGYY